MKRWNGAGRMLKVSQKLVVYVPKAKASKYANVNTRNHGKDKVVAVQEETKKSYNLGIFSFKTSSQTTKKYVYYTVKSGDNFWDIALQYPGISAEDIMQINKLSPKSRIHPGDVLKIKEM